MKRTVLMTMPALVLAGCANDRPTPLPGPARECRAGPGQRFIGATYRVRVGRAIMVTTGARTMRVVPPNGAVTMDFRPDRVTIELNVRRQVKAVRCG